MTIFVQLFLQLMYSGYVTLACHFVYMEAVAQKALTSGKMVEEKAFYESKIQTSEYVFEELLPHTLRLKKTMFTPTKSIMQMSAENFSFNYARK